MSVCARAYVWVCVCVNACVWGEWCKHARVHRQVRARVSLRVPFGCAGPGGWVASGCYDNCRFLLHCLVSVAMLHKVNIVLLLFFDGSVGVFLACPLAALLLVVLVIFGSGLFSGCT